MVTRRARSERLESCESSRPRASSPDSSPLLTAMRRTISEGCDVNGSATPAALAPLASCSAARASKVSPEWAYSVIASAASAPGSSALPEACSPLTRPA